MKLYAKRAQILLRNQPSHQKMYLCIRDVPEKILLHLNIKTTRGVLLTVTEERFQEDIVIAVECILQRKTSVHPVESCLPR